MAGNDEAHKGMADKELPPQEHRESHMPANEWVCGQYLASLDRAGNSRAVEHVLEKQLLRDVYRQPENDGPRLAYAQFLEDKGDPRGEFIRLQVELAQLERAQGKGRVESNPYWHELKVRENELLNNHYRDWVKPLGDGLTPPCEVKFERGFPSALKIRPKDFAASGDEILDRMPTIQAVCLRRMYGSPDEKDQEFNDFWEAPALARVSTLDCRELGLAGQIGDAGAKAIASSPHVGGIRILLLSGCRIGDQGAEALAHSASLNKIEELDLRNNQISNAGARPFLNAKKSGKLPALTSIDLSQQWPRQGLPPGESLLAEIARRNASAGRDAIRRTD